MVWPIWERRDFEVSKTSGPLMVTRTSNWSERMWFWMWTIEATFSPFFTMKAFWKILNLLSIILLILTFFWVRIDDDGGLFIFFQEEKGRQTWMREKVSEKTSSIKKEREYVDMIEAISSPEESVMLGMMQKTSAWGLREGNTSSVWLDPDEDEDEDEEGDEC